MCENLCLWSFPCAVGVPMCKNLHLCIYTCILCFFFGSFSSLCLFVCFVLFQFVIFSCYSLNVCMFSKEKQKGCWFWWDGRWKKTWRSWERENHNQDIMYERNLFSIKKISFIQNLIKLSNLIKIEPWYIQSLRKYVTLKNAKQYSENTEDIWMRYRIIIQFSLLFFCINFFQNNEHL